jgi:hypothetical protein
MSVPTEIPDWVITTAIGIVIVVLAYLNKERLGLGTVQLATQSEREKLLELYEKRIEALEKDATLKDDQIRFLSAENTELRRRLRHLEERLGDDVI